MFGGPPMMMQQPFGQPRQGFGPPGFAPQQGFAPQPGLGPQQAFAPRQQAPQPQQQYQFIPPQSIGAAPAQSTVPAAQRPSAMPNLAQMASGQFNVPPRVSRGHRDESPAPAPTAAPAMPRQVALATPESLGLQPTGTGTPAPRREPTDAADWNRAHARLKQLGAVAFQLQRSEQGGFRFGFMLPTNDANRLQCVEANATTEMEAVELALQRGESWSTSQR